MALDDDVEMIDVSELDSDGDIKMISPVRPVAPKTTVPRAAAPSASGPSAITSRTAASTSRTANVSDTTFRTAAANATASRATASIANASRTTASNNPTTSRTAASNATSSRTAATQTTAARAAAPNSRTPAATSRQPVERALRSGGQLKKASHRVLNNAKLLEKIFAKLPMISLFKIQRTSKTFRKTIKESDACQKKMSLRRDPSISGVVESIHLAKHSGLDCEFRREYDVEQAASVTHKCIKLASREASWRKMLVHRSNIGLVVSKVTMLYRHSHQRAWNKTAKCKTHDGNFTLGELLDAVEAVLNGYWDWRIKGTKLPNQMRDVIYQPPKPGQGVIRL
ncbi:hypothetical protein M409DRAFT_29788 [Zasmidium cellare ATCC 36951]|uniref:F-box domain-containing protein n=1 Tax=Zasmidium cellare ATCC 36951 TaxID=1080233 RepID=A0A6A6C244_ZASCE|nr:uncharacterized protein M409DRAFT_29788 [Zasmidium cellare ATCC 36951]KAF2159789.1 hypothetical protein M409DRAFT_29788 [Zasmidium cellare ATCC 36951]